MMNNSNGFQGGQLGASNGFKRGVRPASGLLKRTEFLRAVDISQSEGTIYTVIGSEIANIQQEINLLDKDKKFRSSEGGLQKGYATAFRKWLRDYNSTKEDDPVKVLKKLGVESFEAGFVKLWKITCNLDRMVTKISELQIINFLTYDEMFDEIGVDTQKSSGLLSSIANNGYVSGTFQITQVLLDRFKDLFAASKKGGITMRKQQSRGREDTNQLIAQLKSQNSKLTALLEQLSSEREAEKRREQEREKENTRAKETKPTTTVLSEHSPKQAFKQIEEKYQEQLRYLTSQKARAEENVVEMKVKIATLESQVKSDAELFKLPSSGHVPKSGSYEQALMEEMEKMKKGFERKIAILTEDFSTRERDLRKKQAQYKSENEKIKWQKSLLLKKFELIPQK